MSNATYYSREITMPKTKKEGLCNFVQMVINRLEAGQHEEALLTAVDLLQDLEGSAYDDAIDASAATILSLQKEMEAKHAGEVMAAHEFSFAAGRDAARREIAEKLGLVAA